MNVRPQKKMQPREVMKKIKEGNLAFKHGDIKRCVPKVMCMVDLILSNNSLIV